MRRLALALLASLAAVGCVPERVAIGPGGELAVHDSVYLPGPDGSLALHTGLTDRVAELHPAWVSPDAPGGRVVRFAWSPRGDRIAVLASQTKDYSAPAVVHLLAWPGLESEASWELPVGQPHLPAFSPDGRRLAFYFDLGREKGSLLAIDVDRPDAPARTLVEHASIGHAWSPDGTRLAVLVGSGSRIQEYSLGTLAVVGVEDGSVRPITGVLFNPTSTVEWSAATGRIHFLSPTVQLPASPEAVAGLPWAVHSVDPAASPATPTVAVPADLPGLSGRIVAFSRAPEASDRFVLVSVEEKVATAWLYQPGASPELVRLHGDGEADRPSAFSIPSWIDGSTWLYRSAKDGIRRGRVGQEPRTLHPTPAATLYRVMRVAIAKLDGSIGEVGGLLEFVRQAGSGSEEAQAGLAGLEELVARGAGTPRERAWLVAVLGRCPDRPGARQALAARLADDAVAEEGGLTVKAYAALALDRMVDGKPYPAGVSGFLDVLRLDDLATKPDASREEELARRAAQWQERLGR